MINLYFLFSVGWVTHDLGFACCHFFTSPSLYFCCTFPPPPSSSFPPLLSPTLFTSNCWIQELFLSLSSPLCPLNLVPSDALFWFHDSPLSSLTSNHPSASYVDLSYPPPLKSRLYSGFLLLPTTHQDFILSSLPTSVWIIPEYFQFPALVLL